MKSGSKNYQRVGFASAVILLAGIWLTANPRMEVSEKTQEPEIVLGGKRLGGRDEIDIALNSAENSISFIHAYESPFGTTNLTLRAFYDSGRNLGLCIINGAALTDLEGNYIASAYEVNCASVKDGLNSATYEGENISNRESLEY